LFSPGTRIAVVTAHPDDTEFYVPGLLTRLGDAGAAITLIVATDGEKAYQPFAIAERNRRVRRAEQHAAAAMWRAREVVYLGYPDSRFQVTAGVISRIERELQRQAPEYVFTFDPAYPPRVTHRDHCCIGDAARRATREISSVDWLVFFSTREPNYALDVTELWDWRWKLLRMHRSQFHGGRLAVARRLITADARAAGRLIGTRYAEALRCMGRIEPSRHE
jgi:LmbE family N-acetylglucosaminyl deacetylase